MEEFIQFFDAWHLDVLDWGILAGVSFVIYVWMGEKCLRNLFAYECSAILCAAPIFLIALVSVVFLESLHKMRYFDTLEKILTTHV